MEVRTWRHNPQINSFTCTHVRGKKMNMFLCGDYEFLCMVSGLSGASGTYPGHHCCPRCLISQDQLKLTAIQRQRPTYSSDRSVNH